jgi:hypothetical protein
MLLARLSSTWDGSDAQFRILVSQTCLKQGSRRSRQRGLAQGGVDGDTDLGALGKSTSRDMRKARPSCHNDILMKD